MQIEVVDNPEAHQFEAFADGYLAGFIDYRLHPGQISLVHTEVGDSFAGKGVASTLVKRSLRMVRESGLTLLPVCPFVRAYIQRHPEDVDLVPASLRSRFNLPAATDAS